MSSSFCDPLLDHSISSHPPHRDNSTPHHHHPHCDHSTPPHPLLCDHSTPPHPHAHAHSTPCYLSHYDCSTHPHPPHYDLHIPGRSALILLILLFTAFYKLSVIRMHC